MRSADRTGSRRRITFISGQLDIGGQERALYLLVRDLDRRFEADVVSLADGGYWAGEIEKLGIPVLGLPRRGSWDLGRLVRLIRHLRRRRPALVYSLGFAANTYGRIAGLCARVPRLVTGWRALEASPAHQFLEVLLARATDRVVCNSQAVLDDVLAHYPIPQERAVLIANGVEPVTMTLDERDLARAEWGAGSSALVVGTVARLGEDKNPMLFIEVASRVQSVRPDILFVLVGGGPLRHRVEAGATAAGLRNIRLLGERTDARRLLSGFDIFVLTSHREGMPNAVLEAMSAGIPCVVTSVGGSREVVLDGETGFHVAPGDGGAMAARILGLVDSPELRARMGSAGSARARTEYSPERMVRNHEALFDALITEPSS